MLSAKCAVKTTDEKCCVFPFIYEGEPHYACTYTVIHSYWCSTTENFDDDDQWGYCQVRFVSV